jgi:hypothetical protein
MQVRRTTNKESKSMNTVSNILLGIMLLNGAILTSFLSYQCWEDFRERRAKNQKQTNSQFNGL